MRLFDFLFGSSNLTKRHRNELLVRQLSNIAKIKAILKKGTYKGVLDFLILIKNDLEALILCEHQKTDPINHKEAVDLMYIKTRIPHVIVNIEKALKGIAIKSTITGDIAEIEQELSKVIAAYYN